MENTIENNPLYKILNPGSVAIFGASNNFTSMGSTQLASLLSMGFPGAIYPIHPREKEVQGLKAYRSILETPETPELAILVLPTTIVADVLEECGKKGVKRAIVISGGFNEVGGEGAQLQKRLVSVAEKYGIRFLGPNCIGVANPHKKLNTTFHPYVAKPGFIGMASQSGSFITQMFDYLKNFGLGFSAGVSVGNEANVDIVDCMNYLAEDPNTKVIALYIEGIRRGREFIQAARNISIRKPIVAFYVGGSEAGRRAGFSHTGALAGPDKVYDGVFRQSGIVRAGSVEELFDFCWALGSAPKPRGNKVIIQTHSGGPGAAAADACGRAGLELPQLSAQTLEKLQRLIPHTASVNNPVDLTFNKNPLDYFSKIPEALLQEPNADGLLVYFLVPSHAIERAMKAMGVPDDKMEEQARKMIREQRNSIMRLMEANGKPLIGYSFRTREDLVVQDFQDGGVCVLPSPERAARAMACLALYTRLREKVINSDWEK